MNSHSKETPTGLGWMGTAIAVTCTIGAVLYLSRRNLSPRRERLLPLRGESAPTPSAPVTKALIPAIGAAYAYGAVFYSNQNKPGQLGGPITVENAAWLTYAIAGWYVMPGFFAFGSRVPAVLRRIYGVYFASFVARGLIEMYLIMGPKAWIPPYGIAHDAVMMLVIAAMQERYHQELEELDETEWGPLRSYLNVLMASLAAEMLFAWLFYQAVDKKTDFLWFADDSPRFAALNPLMRMAVTAVHLDLVTMLWRMYGPSNPGMAPQLAVRSH